MTQWKWETTGDEVVAAFADRVKGKTIVITGPGEGGIGAETAISLAKGGPAQLVLVSRTESKVRPVMAAIERAAPPGTTVRFVAVDLGSQRSVRAAAAQILGLTSRIHLLLNNAAIMACPYALTEEGIESQLATNHVGHFLLTKLLIDRVLAAGPGARIVNVSSSALGSIRFDDYNFQDGATYDPWLGYRQSKACNIVFSRALARKLQDHGIFSYSLHPGSIRSNLQVYMNAAPGGREAAVAAARARAEKAGKTFVLDADKTLQQGCATTLVAALDPSIEPLSGAYLRDGDIGPQDELYLDEADQDRLWALSEKLIGEKFDL